MYFLFIPGKFKAARNRKSKNKCVLKSYFSYIRLSFTDHDNIENDEEFEHSPSEFYFPGEDFDETSNTSRLSESREEIEVFIKQLEKCQHYKEACE